MVGNHDDETYEYAQHSLIRTKRCKRTYIKRSWLAHNVIPTNLLWIYYYYYFHDLPPSLKEESVILFVYTTRVSQIIVPVPDDAQA